MKIKTFDLERIQSLYENEISFNLTESGFHPYSLNQILNQDQLNELLRLPMGYGQTNGSILLRNRISKLYKGLNEENIIVTNGSSEANFIACHTLLDEGDEVVMMVPNYLQIWGIAEEMGAIPKAFYLKKENLWAPDIEQLKSLVNSKTKMIALCNPNNPTGYILSRKEMDQIISIAREFDAWIYCDEIYRGAELNGVETHSFIGKYDKVLVTGGFSKAYALPGLRLGWLAGPKATIADTWAYHDYTSIASGLLSQKIGEWVLEEDLRRKILQRNQKLLNENLRILQLWLKDQNLNYQFIPPQGGGMAFISYDLEISSNDLSNYLRQEHDLFVAAGSWFGVDGHIRLGIGAESMFFETCLGLLEAAFEDLLSNNLI